MPPDQIPSRRTFLGAVGGTLAGLGGLFRPAVAGELARTQKRAILVWMSGGPSQFETWDPKPGRPTGGPHGAIPTSRCGVYFNEYMPRLARLADRMVVVRSVTSASKEHGQATFAGMTGGLPGRLPTPPAWLSACAHGLTDDATWPAFVALGQSDSSEVRLPGGGFLGPRFDPVPCPGNGKPPEGLPTKDADVETVRRRDGLRDRLTADFRYGHDPARLAAHDQAHRQLATLVDRRSLFDLTREPARRVAAYGNTRLGRDCLLACRLVEHGVPFVLVGGPAQEWDLHGGIKDEQPGITARFDTAVGALIDDLMVRGLWDHTLVVLMGEFGRTPKLAGRSDAGRDHWSKCWSMSFGGVGAARGVVVGSTDYDGTDVRDHPVTIPDLLATFYTALGIDPRKDIDVDGRPTLLLERGVGKPITEALA